VAGLDGAVVGVDVNAGATAAIPAALVVAGRADREDAVVDGAGRGRITLRIDAATLRAAVHVAELELRAVVVVAAPADLLAVAVGVADRPAGRALAVPGATRAAPSIRGAVRT